MKAVNVNKIRVFSTPDELRKLADSLEQWWEEDYERTQCSNLCISVTGDNAQVDFFLDIDKMGER